MVVQAIGSEVAAETRRSAEMNAPAKTVALWRTEANEVNIGNPFSSFHRARHWARATMNAWGVPITKYRYISVCQPLCTRRYIAQFTLNWSFLPRSSAKYGEPCPEMDRRYSCSAHIRSARAGASGDGLFLGGDSHVLSLEFLGHCSTGSPAGPTDLRLACRLRCRAPR